VHLYDDFRLYTFFFMCRIGGSALHNNEIPLKTKKLLNRIEKVYERSFDWGGRLLKSNGGAQKQILINFFI